MVKHDIDSWILDEETLAECYREKGNVQGYESKMELVGLLEQLKEYQQLEEQGRLIKLPCKVGDDVYYILGIPNETPCTIGTCTFKLSDIHKIGKTLFLTKSEAEAKLKELRGKENDQRR